MSEEITTFHSKIEDFLNGLSKEEPNSTDSDFQADLDIFRLLANACDIFAARFQEPIDSKEVSFSDLSIKVEGAFINIINLLDISDPTWHRKKSDHLAKGFAIIADGKYTLYGVTRINNKALPSDMNKFPRTI
ncbi:hypothetical protein [Deinococcus frigens]|uniref:hypothetical protein n=1 Tax=Deinococcus frigens TaxID=249403 RepID=UPI0012ECA15E|nr:hypothetical protein [Deinococcus frigens]